MESEILKAMKDDMYFSLLIEVIMLITVLLATAGFAWLCFKETRRTAHRQIKPTIVPDDCLRTAPASMFSSR